MVPYNWLHFFGVSLSDSCDFTQLFKDDTQLHEISMSNVAQYFTGAIHYRGKFTGCPEDAIKDSKFRYIYFSNWLVVGYDTRRQPCFMDWLKDSVITSYVSEGSSSSCLLANSAAIRHVVSRYDTLATEFYKAGKFHLSGDKELDFFEAQTKVSDFRDQYIYTHFYDDEDEENVYFEEE